MNSRSFLHFLFTCFQLYGRGWMQEAVLKSATTLTGLGKDVTDSHYSLATSH